MEIAAQSVRALFVSDVHLGSDYCQAGALCELLRRVVPEQLYIVGDFCDGWLLRRRWRWHSVYSELLDRVQSLSNHGVQVTYLLGNHDRCLTRWISEWGQIDIVEKCVHVCGDGRRLLVIHGDQFDGTQNDRYTRAATLSAIAHEQLLGGSRAANRWLGRIGLQQRKFATAITTPLKTLAHALGNFWMQATQYAASQGCHGVLCGHTHNPMLREQHGVVMANCGDWLEHCSCIVETNAGQLELWNCAPNGRTPVRTERLAGAQFATSGISRAVGA